MWDQESVLENLASGRTEPLSLLMKLNETNASEDIVQRVIEVAPQYLYGSDRLRFRTLANKLYPSITAEQNRPAKEHAASQREAQSASFGNAISSRVESYKEKAKNQSPMPSGGSWQMPLDTPRQGS